MFCYRTRVCNFFAFAIFIRVNWIILFLRERWFHFDEWLLWIKPSRLVINSRGHYSWVMRSLRTVISFTHRTFVQRIFLNFVCLYMIGTMQSTVIIICILYENNLALKTKFVRLIYSFIVFHNDCIIDFIILNRIKS